jgi:lactoylglutathione lyase
VARWEAAMKLVYAIKFVADMEEAIAFHRDILGLSLKFQSPFWSEFLTGETTLALHPSSGTHPPGAVQLGFNVEDLEAFYARREALGLEFTSPPTDQHGSKIARFLDCEGAEMSISG